MVKMSYYTEYTDVVADKHKVPGYRGVPLKNGAGLYRAGVAELIRHIIRMCMMSTKMSGLLLVAVGVGTMEEGQVSQYELYGMLLLMPGMVFLDLFIYLNFEQKQHDIHHRQFVDIFNLHGRNIASVVSFKQKK